jgi:hypothetical protein
MLHLAMPSVSLWHTAMAIETASGQGAFIRHQRFYH